MTTGFTTAAHFEGRERRLYGRRRLKPRISYLEFRQKKDGRPYQEGSLAWLIQRVIEDVAANPSMRQFNGRYLLHLRFIQRTSIGSKQAPGLRKADFIEFCKERRRTTGKSTVMHDFVKIRMALKYASANWGDDWDEALAAMEPAKLFLVNNEIIGKGARRTRRPTDEEIAALLDYFERENVRARNKIKAMPSLIAFGLKSARRRGEIVSIMHGDVDYVNKTYRVRNMKSKVKGLTKEFILWPELEAIILAQPRIDPNDPTERIFPYDGNVVGQKYSLAKTKLGIVDLRFHDNRADALSKWLLKMPPEDVRLAVSGHENTKILEKHYDRRTTAELIREKYREVIAKLQAPSVPAAAPMPVTA